MTEEELKSLAGQLRKPDGEHGVDVGNFMNAGNEALHINTLSFLNLEPDQTILEVGMGNGNLMSHVLGASPNCRYYGCDYSQLMVSESIKNNQELVDQGRLSFHHCHAHDMPIEKQHIDRLFSVNTIYFWENPSAILNEFKRVLKPNGILCLGMRPRRLMQHYDFVKYGFQMFESDDVKKLLAVNGFKQTEAYTVEEEDWVSDDQRFEVESLVVRAQI